MSNSIETISGTPQHLTARVLILTREASGDTRGLVLRRALQDEFRAGEWDLPGGRANIGEAPIQAAIRETAEESGIMLATEGLHLFYDRTDTVRRRGTLVDARRMVFEGQLSTSVDETPVTLSFEHIEYDWLSLEGITAALGSTHYRQAVEEYVRALPIAS